MRVYNRSVGSMLEFLGDMGGLIEIVFLFVAGVIYLVLDRNFWAAIISDTYKVQKYSRDESEFYKSKKDRENKGTHAITSESLSGSSGEEDNKSEKSSSSDPLFQENTQQLSTTQNGTLPDIARSRLRRGTDFIAPRSQDSLFNGRLNTSDARMPASVDQFPTVTNDSLLNASILGSDTTNIALKTNTSPSYQR